MKNFINKHKFYLGLSSIGRIDRVEETIQKQKDEIIQLKSENQRLRNDLEDHRRRTDQQIGQLYDDIRSGKIKIESTIVIED